MDRREALKRTALLTGYALSASTVAAVLNGCQSEVKGEPDWEPTFLSKEQGATVAELAECIFPKTDTPGAKDAGVHEFIDIMLAKYSKEEDQMFFMRGLEEIATSAQEAHQKAFVDLSAEEQTSLLQGIYETDKARIAAGEKGFKSFFMNFRQSVIAAYFTSEKIGEEVLSYLPIPGEYIGCMPLEEVGNAWSLN